MGPTTALSLLLPSEFGLYDIILTQYNNHQTGFSALGTVHNNHVFPRGKFNHRSWFLSQISYISFLEHFIGSSLLMAPQTHGHNACLYPIIFYLNAIFLSLIIQIPAMFHGLLQVLHFTMLTVFLCYTSNYWKFYFSLNHTVLACYIYVKVILLSYLQRDVSFLKGGEGFELFFGNWSFWQLIHWFPHLCNGNEKITCLSIGVILDYWSP